MAQPSNKVYSQELKLQAVCEYLDGKSTQADILVEMITKYIHYYNSERIQRKLYRMTPMEFHAAFAAAA
jgi:transposase InsO family protein